MTKYVKPGDKIRIMVPKLFVRCGYLLNPEKILTERQQQVDALVMKAWKAMRYPGREEIETNFLVEYTEDIPWRVKRHLTSSVVSMILNCEHFGGKERQIFEEEIPLLKGKEVTVVKKRIVKTGFYTYGGYEETSYLSDVKSHCVYNFVMDEPLFNSVPSDLIGKYYSKFEILASNVERVENDSRIYNNRQEEVQASCT